MKQTLKSYWVKQKETKLKQGEAEGVTVEADEVPIGEAEGMSH